MRLSFVTDTFPPDVNGVANTLRRLQNILRQRGHEVETIVPGDLLDAALIHGSIAPVDSSARLRLAALPLPGYKGLRIGLPARGTLAKHWSPRPPDVVYVATESLLGSSAIDAAGDVGSCVVSGYHTNFDQYLRDYHLPMLEDVANAYLRRLHNRTRATFAPSPDAIDRLRALGFSNLRMLGRGVDIVQFDPAKRCERLRASWGAGEQDTVALYVGRLAPEKNLPLAMRAFEVMARHETSQGRNFRAVLVGDGPLHAELRADAGHWRFAGTRTGEELAVHYASADIFIFPSLTETFGNVVIEAMASGLVTVAYDCAAAAVHLKHQVNGLSAPIGDETGFLGVCIAALDRNGWPDWRREARLTASRLTWSEVVSNFEKDLSDLLS
ncbi:MAG: glycosyltransferase family 1 protein [Verrucomicrobiota bacterium]